MSYLRSYNNQLSGSIPAELGAMNKIKRMWLYGNQLSGTIPAELGNLSTLEVLYLYNNQLTGAIPTRLGNLSNLQFLDFHSNSLSGNIPPTLGNLDTLIHLYLYDNDLSGTIPSELGNLSYLQRLLIGQNQLTGAIPPSLGNMENLNLFYIDNNQLSGELPSELANLSNLTAIQLQSNNLRGCFPMEYNAFCDISVRFDGNPLLPQGGDFAAFCASSLGACSPCRTRDSLALVDIYNAAGGASWTIPWNLNQPLNTWHGISTNTDGCVTILNLSNNNLTGTLPTSVGNMYQLTDLDLSGNNLTGTIPTQLETCYELAFLDLSQNNLNGAIPVKLGNISNLQYLFLNNNALSGAIPAEIGQLNKLEILRLEENDLTGTIPEQLWQLTQLQKLTLQANNLTGTLSPNIGKLTKLQVFRAGNNGLTGAVPAILWSLYELTELGLENNTFTGTLPSSIGSLTKLQTLVLSDNAFSGALPSQFSNLTAIQSIEIQNNSFSGQLPVALANLPNLNYLTAQNNQFVGCFPPEYANLCSIGTVNFNGNTGLSNNGNFVSFCNGSGGACLENDDCVTAITLPMNLDPCGVDSRQVILDGAGASINGPYSTLYSSTFAGNDVWFKTTVPATGNLLIRKDSSTNIRLYAEVYSSCPSSAADTLTSGYLANNPNVLVISHVPGQEIYIRVWDSLNLVVNQTGIATSEISAHQLSANPDEWKLCDFKESIVGASDGTGTRLANEFIVQFPPDATPAQVQALRDSLGITEYETCDCSEAPIELWKTTNPINTEDKRNKTAASGTVANDTIGYNYEINIVQFVDTLRSKVVTENSFNAKIALDSVGNYVVVWQEFGKLGDGIREANIYAQRFNAREIAQGDKFVVNTNTSLSQTRPEVAMSKDGDFAITWFDNRDENPSNTSPGQVWVKNYNRLGFPIQEQLVGNNLFEPSVAMDSDGNFVVAYRARETNGTGYIGVKQFDRNGNTIRTIPVTPVAGAATDISPKVATTADGNFTVAWINTASDVVNKQLFNASGVALTNLQSVSHAILSQPFEIQDNVVNLSMSNDGNAILSWQQFYSGSEENYYTSELFDRYGDSRMVFPVRNTYFTGLQEAGTVPEVAMDGKGDFIVVWSENYNGFGGAYTVKGAYFDSLGTKIGDDVVININETGEYVNDVAMNDAGKVAVVFSSSNDIFTKCFNSNSSSEPLSDVRTTYYVEGTEKGNFTPYAPATPTSSIRVAVMDSGVKKDDPNFTDALWRYSTEDGSCEIENNSNDTGFDYVNKDGDPDDLDGHGHAVNGRLIAGFPSDIDLELINIKLYESNKSTLFGAVCGMYYAIEQGAKVINQSWSFESAEYPSILKNALDYARCQDVLVVTSAGNTGTNNTLLQKYPSNFSEAMNNIITVAAYERELEGNTVTLAGYSNFGSNVDIAAPGYLETLDLQGNVVALVGTSLAAPEVARVAAIIRARYPQLTAVEVKECIMTSADNFGLNVRSGGILNETAALSCAAQKSLVASAPCQSEKIVLDATAISESCVGDNGSITLLVSGSELNPSYLWSNGATTKDISGLMAGTYTVTVTDACGCIKTLSQTVMNNCNGGVSCPTNLTLNANPLISDVYKATTITSSAIINPGTSVTFEASNQITLLPNFHAKQGATFSAKIQTCVPSNLAVESRNEPQARIQELALTVSPNPFSQDAQISYYLPEAMDVTLSLYNIKGQFIKYLVHGSGLEGWNNVTLETNDLASGMYYLRLQSKNHYLVQKLVKSE
ncbi:MAG: S8 family serine peptidase [Saprospiraceae bacterium]|nr:S8 family serine peptidase [Saprospiraceae bacterium]